MTSDLTIDFISIARAVIDKRINNIEQFKKARHNLQLAAHDKHESVIFDIRESTEIIFEREDKSFMAGIDLLHTELKNIKMIILPRGKRITGSEIKLFICALRLAHIVTCLTNALNSSGFRSEPEATQMNFLIARCREWIS
jgi:hypothetical protein